jgi:ribosomal subunit interface protein
MHLTKIYASNMELSDALRSYVEKKFLGLTKFTVRFPAVAECEVEIGKTTHHQKGEVFRAEANLTIPGAVLRAEATADDPYAAIDRAKDALKAELIREQKKRRAVERKSETRWKRWLNVRRWGGK